MPNLPPSIKPTEHMKTNLLAYQLQIPSQWSNRMTRLPHEEPYQELFSPLGDTGLVYLPRSANYRYKGEVWYLLANRELPGLFCRSQVRYADRTTFAFPKLMRYFARMLERLDPERGMNHTRLGLALSLCSNHRNITGGHGHRRLRYSLADCYRLAQGDAAVDTWAKILSIWERELPTDALAEIMAGTSVSLMLNFAGSAQPVDQVMP